MLLMKSILLKVVCVLCIYLKFKLMALIYVPEKNNTNINNILRYNHNEISIGIGVQCHFILSLYVLCIVLTNLPNHWAAYLKKKGKGKSMTLRIDFLLLTKITNMETHNSTEWDSYQILGLVLLMGRIVQWATIRLFLSVVLMASKLLNKLLIH